MLAAWPSWTWLQQTSHTSQGRIWGLAAPPALWVISELCSPPATSSPRGLEDRSLYPLVMLTPSCGNPCRANSLLAAPAAPRCPTSTTGAGRRIASEAQQAHVMSWHAAKAKPIPGSHYLLHQLSSHISNLPCSSRAGGNRNIAPANPLCKGSMANPQQFCVMQW